MQLSGNLARVTSNTTSFADTSFANTSFWSKAADASTELPSPPLLSVFTLLKTSLARLGVITSIRSWRLPNEKVLQRSLHPDSHYRRDVTQWLRLEHRIMEAHHGAMTSICRHPLMAVQGLLKRDLDLVPQSGSLKPRRRVTIRDLLSKLCRGH